MDALNNIQVIQILSTAKLASNVLGMRRFAVADKGLRSKTSNRKMWLQGGVGMK